jgi:hypothetical protein
MCQVSLFALDETLHRPGARRGATGAREGARTMFLIVLACGASPFEHARWLQSATIIEASAKHRHNISKSSWRDHRGSRL